MIKKILEFYHKLLNVNRKPGWYQEVDNRNFLGKNLAGEISVNDLTDSNFQTVVLNKLIDQDYTDYCVACGSAYGSEATEGIPMSWRGAYALMCKHIKTIPAYGASILKMLIAKTVFGIPERELCEFQPDKGREWNADPKNLNQEMLDNALKHRAGSVWEAVRPYGWDRFDTFLAYLNKFKKNKIVIQTGIDSHNVSLIGVGPHPVTGERCLFGPDSYGNSNINYRVGKSINGYRYWNRKEANQLPTGNFTFDMPRALAELLNTYDNKAVKVEGNPDCYIVLNGKKHSLINEYVAWAYNTLMFDPNNFYTITQEEFDLIPTGDVVKFKEGKYWQIVTRMLEKEGNTKVLEQLKNL